MTDLRNAGPYTVTLGLYHGSEYVYVTHRESGRQWMSKSPTDPNRDLSLLASNIDAGVTRFDHTKVMESCDARFWTPVKQPV